MTSTKSLPSPLCYLPHEVWRQVTVNLDLTSTSNLIQSASFFDKKFLKSKINKLKLDEIFEIVKTLHKSRKTRRELKAELDFKNKKPPNHELSNLMQSSFEEKLEMISSTSAHEQEKLKAIKSINNQVDAFWTISNMNKVFKCFIGVMKNEHQPADVRFTCLETVFGLTKTCENLKIKNWYKSEFLKGILRLHTYSYRSSTAQTVLENLCMSGYFSIQLCSETVVQAVKTGESLGTGLSNELDSELGARAEVTVLTFGYLRLLEWVLAKLVTVIHDLILKIENFEGNDEKCIYTLLLEELISKQPEFELKVYIPILLSRWCSLDPVVRKSALACILRFMGLVGYEKLKECVFDERFLDEAQIFKLKDIFDNAWGNRVQAKQFLNRMCYFKM